MPRVVTIGCELFNWIFCSAPRIPARQRIYKLAPRPCGPTLGPISFTYVPQGKPDAQVLQGIVTLAYPNIDTVYSRFNVAAAALRGSQFACTSKSDNGSSSSSNSGGVLAVTDPWGNQFRIVSGAADERDARDRQPGDISE